MSGDKAQQAVCILNHPKGVGWLRSGLSADLSVPSPDEMRKTISIHCFHAQTFNYVSWSANNQEVDPPT